MSSKTQSEKDEALMHFLGMTADRCDIDAATQILEAHNWEVDKAVLLDKF